MQGRSYLRRVLNSGFEPPLAQIAVRRGDLNGVVDVSSILQMACLRWLPPALAPVSKKCPDATSIVAPSRSAGTLHFLRLKPALTDGSITPDGRGLCCVSARPREGSGCRFSAHVFSIVVLIAVTARISCHAGRWGCHTSPSSDGIAATTANSAICRVKIRRSRAGGTNDSLLINRQFANSAGFLWKKRTANSELMVQRVELSAV